MSNRVEDLERQVAELQAAVNGLTEELVEMKERVRQLEDAEEVEVERNAQPAAGPTAGEAEPTERTVKSDDHADVVETTDAGASDGEAAGGDDIRVPEQEATTPDAEASKSEEAGGEEEDEESESSDIIVA